MLVEVLITFWEAFLGTGTVASSIVEWLAVGSSILILFGLVIFPLLKLIKIWFK